MRSIMSSSSSPELALLLSTEFEPAAFLTAKSDLGNKRITDPPRIRVPLRAQIIVRRRGCWVLHILMKLVAQGIELGSVRVAGEVDGAVIGGNPAIQRATNLRLPLAGGGVAQQADARLYKRKR